MLGFINQCRPPEEAERIAIRIAPQVRLRLRRLLFRPEMRGIGYSAFINRACEIAETEIAEHRRNESSGRT